LCNRILNNIGAV